MPVSHCSYGQSDVDRRAWRNSRKLAGRTLGTGGYWNCAKVELWGLSCHVADPRQFRVAFWVQSRSNKSSFEVLSATYECHPYCLSRLNYVWSCIRIPLSPPCFQSVADYEMSHKSLKRVAAPCEPCLRGEPTVKAELRACAIEPLPRPRAGCRLPRCTSSSS